MSGSKGNSEWAVSLERKMTGEEINQLDPVTWPGPIHLIKDQNDMLKAVRVLKKEKLLGFDTETRPAFKKGESYQPSLLQLGGETDVYIFQLKQLEDLTKLFKLLSSRRIIKTGVAVGYDVRELRKLHNFKPRNFVDLGDCARNAGMNHHGLRGLAALLLGERITKGAQRTNWARPNLPSRAIKYAATDAWIGRRIYAEMKKHRCKLASAKFKAD